MLLKIRRFFSRTKSIAHTAAISFESKLHTPTVMLSAPSAIRGKAYYRQKPTKADKNRQKPTKPTKRQTNTDKKANKYRQNFCRYLSAFLSVFVVCLFDKYRQKGGQ